MTSTNEEVLIEATRALAPQIRACAEEIERERRLPPSLVQALAEAGLFRLAVPKELGGEEVDPLVLARIIEEVAKADSSVGWCVMIGAQAAWESAFLPEEAAQEIFGRNPQVVVGGVVIPTGKAVAVAGGYRVSGRWAFASGCQHSTWLFGNCVLLDGDTPRLGPKGAPEMRLMVFSAADCTILDTWTVTGLRGTGSHDFTVTEAFVPSARSVAWPRTAPPRHPGPLYHNLVLGKFVLHASHALGIARSAIDALVELAAAKTPMGSKAPLREQATVQGHVARADALVESARAYLYGVAGTVRDMVVAGHEPSLQQRARLQLAITHTVTNCVQAVDLMFSAGEGTAIYARSPLDRHFRDIHTAAAHLVVSPRLYESTGRVLLGLEPGTPFW